MKTTSQTVSESDGCHGHSGDSAGHGPRDGQQALPPPNRKGRCEEVTLLPGCRSEGPLRPQSSLLGLC